MKLYWATDSDSLEWMGPCASESEAIAEARSWGMGVEGDVQAIWIAPVADEYDDDEKFWDEVAALFLRESETVDETLSEDGWTDPEDSWLPSWPNDRDRILANALRQVLGPRPAWRCIDTAKARKVDL